MDTKRETKKAPAPRLRFPGFEGAWELVKLKDISVSVTQKVGQRKLTPVSISAGIGFVPQTEKFGRDISGNQYELYTLVRDGEFVFNKGNSKTYPQGCVYLLEGWGEVAAPNVFISFRLKKGYVNGFFRYIFEKNTHGLELKPHITSGARSNGLLNISKEDFFDIYLPTTSEDEQQHIAAALSSLDAVIAAQQGKLEALRQHKQGLMQGLFPAEGERVPRLRFPEFAGAGEWKCVKLSDISVPVTERVGQRKLTPISISAGIGFIPQSEKFGRDISGNQYELYTLVRDGDFVFNKGNSKAYPQGCVYLLEGWGEVAVPNVFISFRLKENCANGFFRYVFEKNTHGRQLRPYVTSSVRSNGLLNINKETFFAIELPTTVEAEQQHIAAALSSLDDLIAAQGERVAALQAFKRGLMQGLFPRAGEE